MTNRTDAQLIYDAADLMELRGYCSYELENDRGEVCTEGALSLAFYGNAQGPPDGNDAYLDANLKRLYGVVLDHLPPENLTREALGPTVRLLNWNDSCDLGGKIARARGFETPEDSQAYVVGELRRVAAEIEAVAVPA